jgi:histidine triad (HIT) family protein
VIPKGDFVSMADFTEHADSATIAGFWRAVGAVARTLDLVGGGYRLLSNVGLNGGQEVPHMHVHIFAGQPLGGMLPPAE